RRQRRPEPAHRDARLLAAGGAARGAAPARGAAAGVTRLLRPYEGRMQAIRRPGKAGGASRTTMPRTLSRERPGHRRVPVLLVAAALRADPDRDVDRGALEAELLAEPALDEAAIAVLQEAGGEEHEARGLGARL